MDTENIEKPLLVLLTIILIGTIGFHLIEGEPLLDSFYWTIVTITTVGFGDFAPETMIGKIFSIGLIISGVSVILYTFTAIGRNIIEGRVREYFSMREKEKEISDLEDHLVICGFGSVGQAIFEKLEDREEKIVIIDNNENLLRQEASENLYIIGDATEEDVLEQANVDKAKGLFAALPNDSENILVTLSARELNTDLKIIARANSREVDKHLYRAGAESVVHPRSEGGIHMARAWLHPEVAKLYERLLEDDSNIASALMIPEDSELVGKSLENSGMREKFDIFVLGIKRKDDVIINPQPDSNLESEDMLIIVGTSENLDELKREYSLSSEFDDISFEV